MRFIEPQTEAEQLQAALCGAREGLITERSATINWPHTSLPEFGAVVPLARATLCWLADVLAMHDRPPKLVQLIHRLYAHDR
ncbi:hypothetical protein [Paraburkholderia sp. 32]|uniref:hypothetical protein n=1 Tax=unclassified Paraburkholderia TaxID=2615204 RepID=UPI003D2255DA